MIPKGRAMAFNADAAKRREELVGIVRSMGVVGVALSELAPAIASTIRVVRKDLLALSQQGKVNEVSRKRGWYRLRYVAPEFANLPCDMTEQQAGKRSRELLQAVEMPVRQAWVQAWDTPVKAPGPVSVFQLAGAPA